MATVPHSRINLLGGTVVASRRSLFSLIPALPWDRCLRRCALFVHRLLWREPTLFIEIGAVYVIAVWSVCMLVPDAYTRDTSLRHSQPFLEYTTYGIAGVLVASVQASAIFWDRVRWRAYLSFTAGAMLGYLGGAFIAIDPLLPAGWVYLGGGFLCVIPFWRDARKTLANRSV